MAYGTIHWNIVLICNKGRPTYKQLYVLFVHEHSHYHNYWYMNIKAIPTVLLYKLVIGDIRFRLRCLWLVDSEPCPGRYCPHLVHSKLWPGFTARVLLSTVDWLWTGSWKTLSPIMVPADFTASDPYGLFSMADWRWTLITLEGFVLRWFAAVKVMTCADYPRLSGSWILSWRLLSLYFMTVTYSDIYYNLQNMTW